MLYEKFNTEIILNTALGVMIGLIIFLLLVIIVIYVWLRFSTKNPGIKNTNDDDETLDDLDDLFDDV